DAATLNISGIVGKTVHVGTPRRYVIVANVAGNAVHNGTINLQIVNNGNVTSSANTINTTAPYPAVPINHTVQDVTAPTIAVLTPPDNATGVIPSANLSIQFSESVAVGAGNITIVETGVGNFEVIPVNDPRVTILGNTVTINPDGVLAFGTAYHVLIDNGAFVDVANNAFTGINNQTTWNFTSVANTSPTIEGAGIADVVVDESAPPTVIDLPPAFQDAETADANLVYSVEATNFVSGDAEIFSGVTVDNNADTLTLSYLPNSNGVFTITVRATDEGALFVEDTFQVTVNAIVEPVTGITNLVVTPTNGFIAISKTLPMTATGIGTNGTTNVTLASTWSSGDTNIATVDNAGVVMGLSAGDVAITAVFDDLTNSATVKVRKEFAITFSKIKPAKRTTQLKVGKAFKVKGKFDTGTNVFTKADITTLPLKIQLAFLFTSTNTNGGAAQVTAFQDVTKIKGFKATKPKSLGKFIAKSVGADLPAGNATVLLQATLGPDGINQAVSPIFTNPTPFEVRRKINCFILKFKLLLSHSMAQRSFFIREFALPDMSLIYFQRIIS
ncbi:MAG: Ig-like domain-containing protein, partial [Verrucomicrobiia bacterium]